MHKEQHLKQREQYIQGLEAETYVEGGNQEISVTEAEEPGAGGHEGPGGHYQGLAICPMKQVK